MKLAVISDIHANLSALEAVIADAEGVGADQFICLGDIVGYGPQPTECLRLVRDLNCPTVRGNHDHDASNNRSLESLHPDAQASLEWTRGILTEPDKEWLSSLPYVRRVGRFSIAHATPRRSNLFGYVHNLAQADECLREQEAPLCFIGHTHVPALFEHFEGKTTQRDQALASLTPSSKYLCNTGAVGQPRDNDIRACYTIYDRAENTLERRRVEYDVSKTQDLLGKAGLPSSLAVRLTDVA